MTNKTLVSVVLVAASAGCGDNAVLVMRDAITTRNEVADILDKIPADQPADTTEALAKAITETHFKAIKAKWDDVKKRVEGFSKYDKDQKTILLAAVNYFAKEGMDTDARVQRSAARVDQIRAKLGRESDFPKLVECVKFQTTIKGHREAARDALNEFLKKETTLKLTDEGAKFLAQGS